VSESERIAREIVKESQADWAWTYLRSELLPLAEAYLALDEADWQEMEHPFDAAEFQKLREALDEAEKALRAADRMWDSARRLKMVAGASYRQFRIAAHKYAALRRIEGEK